MIEDKHAAKKRFRIYDESYDAISSCKTTEYVVGIKGDDSYNDRMDVDHYMSASSRAI